MTAQVIAVAVATAGVVSAVIGVLGYRLQARQVSRQARDASRQVREAAISRAQTVYLSGMDLLASGRPQERLIEMIELRTLAVDRRSGSTPSSPSRPSTTSCRCSTASRQLSTARTRRVQTEDMSATSAASIPVTQDAVEVARRAAAEFTDRGVPVPALLELIAHTTAGHQITTTELPTPGPGAESPRHGRTTPLLAHR